VTVMKKLALGITGVGIACITGLGLAQPASATFSQSGNLECEGYFLQVDCSINDVQSQQVWSYNGRVQSQWNGLRDIHFSCGPANTRWTISVTYLDGTGVSQTDSLSQYCTNNPPA
jgi:hypothetical protein